MKRLNLSEHPHRRYNPLTGEWILVSPQRTQRPWRGHIEPIQKEERPAYDPSCYLCPGNARAGSEKNPEYSGTFVFDNDFSGLLPDTPAGRTGVGDLLVARGERGICRVVCFSPRHDLTLAEMGVADIRRVVDVWIEECRNLSRKPFIRYVQIFENKGEMMGCSNPHPHGQIWAEGSVPVEPSKESVQFTRYRRKHRACLLCDYLKLELKQQDRIVCENDGFVALVPFWAVWPFETMIVSRRHIGTLTALAGEEPHALADILRRVTVRYDNLFRVSFPYSSGFHQSPTDGASHHEWHLHMHFFPPLLRSATIRKFMVGYEMLANPQRDLTAELSAEKLRGAGEVHYKTSRVEDKRDERREKREGSRE